MKSFSGWMRVGVVAGVAAMMLGSAGAQTPDTQVAADALAQAAKVQAEQTSAAEQAQMDKLQRELQRMAPDKARLDALSSASVQAQMAKVQAEMARMGPEIAKMSALSSADQQAMQAKIQAEMAPLQAKLQVELLPMQAKLEMGLAPMRAEMMARSAAMQAQMLAQGAMMQAGMVNVGDPQVKDDLFDGTEKFAKGASNVTSVNLGPDMLGMVSGKHGGDMAHKLNFMIVRSYEYPHAGMYNPADLDVYRQKLKAGKWNCFIHTYESESGESTDICNRPLPGGEGNEMVIMTAEPKELTFIHMSGKGSLADLGKLGALGRMGGVVPEMPEQPERPEKPERPEPQ